MLSPAEFQTLVETARRGKHVDLDDPRLTIWQSAVLRVYLRNKK
jgi:hypothetical protein